MKFNWKELMQDLFQHILKHKRVRNLWIFGLILIIFSIFIDIKMILVIFILMFLLTVGTFKSIEKEENEDLEILNEELTVLEMEHKVMKEHIDSGQATMEEKLQLAAIEKDIFEIKQELEVKNSEK
ncbi:hypothetical protein [Bacillus toyonensis]|uniref:hypothetical protein n=1 Tax=Bacillus toyonensis TaxID=155322 RepID=UPI002E1CF89A|nr:hypothetical protein [Bacillus toyonensis]